MVYGVYRHFQQYFSYIATVSFIGWRKLEYPEKTTESRKSLTNFYHIILYQVHFATDGFELTTLAVIGTDCTCSCKSNYHHTITAPKFTFLKSKCFKSCLKMKADTSYCVNIV